MTGTAQIMFRREADFASLVELVSVFCFIMSPDSGLYIFDSPTSLRNACKCDTLIILGVLYFGVLDLF